MNITNYDVAIVLQDWYDWVRDGAPVDNPHDFSRRAGLCFAVSSHPRFANMTFSAMERDQSDALAEMLSEDGLDTDYPFDFDAISYENAYLEHTHHLNQRRIAWVLKIITAFGGG